jgi:signal transduction histidine kinase
MDKIGEPTLTPTQRLVENVARTLRHEIGDLLQTVYATVAILQERLGPQLTLERRLLADLRSRAETCRNELDAAHDLVCPLTMTVAPLDLAELVGGTVATFTRRFPDRPVRFEAQGPVPVRGDARRLAQVASLLLLSAYQAAQKEVRVWVQGVGGEGEWGIGHDGSPANDEQMSWLDAPFTTTHHAQFGLGLALAGRLAGLLGGRVQAGNPPEGGFRVSLFLPLARPGA